MSKCNENKMSAKFDDRNQIIVLRQNHSYKLELKESILPNIIPISKKRWMLLNYDSRTHYMPEQLVDDDNGQQLPPIP